MDAFRPAVYVVGYCERTGLDARDLTLDVRLDKVEKACRLYTPSGMRLGISLDNGMRGDKAPRTCVTFTHRLEIRAMQGL